MSDTIAFDCDSTLEEPYSEFNQSALNYFNQKFDDEGQQRDIDDHIHNMQLGRPIVEFSKKQFVDDFMDYQEEPTDEGARQGAAQRMVFTEIIPVIGRVPIRKYHIMP